MASILPDQIRHKKVWTKLFDGVGEEKVFQLDYTG